MKTDYEAPFITDIKVVPSTSTCESAFEDGADVMPIFSRDHPGTRVLYNDPEVPFLKQIRLIVTGSGNGKTQSSPFPLSASFPRVSAYTMVGQKICAKKMDKSLQSHPGFEGWVSPNDAQASCPSGTVACDIDVGNSNVNMTCLKKPSGQTINDAWKRANCPITKVVVRKVNRDSRCSGN